MMLYDLKGKIAFVTGGATGIGFSCTKELLRIGVQAVTIADVNDLHGEMAVKELTREFGPNRAIFLKTDVLNPAQLEDAIIKTINTWRTIDVIINNAGVFNDANWEQEIAINSTAVVRGTLLGLQYMGKDKGGKGGVIVNVASVLGLQPLSSAPIYAATKHLVVGFSRSLGTPYHYNRTGVKIVTLCPGVTNTMLVDKADQATLTPDMGMLLVKELSDFPGQTVDNVGRGVIKPITEGDNGSVWVAEDNETVYEVDFPDWRTFRKC